MKVIAVTSGKGGVGKTTLSLNIAKQLSLSGHRTLLVDLDIHNKGATSLFLDIVEKTSEKNQGMSFAGMIAARNAGAPETVHALTCELDPSGTLSFIPATLPKEMVEWGTLQSSNNEALIELVAGLIRSEGRDQTIDIVVLDCYGGIDSLTVAACGVANDTIIVNEPDLITFSGTLLLYSYISRVYRNSSKKPRVHFVINRVTSRHSFEFLDREYRKDLAPLAFNERILAYLPYDRLVVETFGDYPFFSELLPKSLITRKIRLLLWRICGDPTQFPDINSMRERGRRKLFRKTFETRLADPETILRAIVSIPIWLIIPGLTLLSLPLLSDTWALPYGIVWQLIYFPTIMLLFLVFVLGVFEPIQISRWLQRAAKFRRRKRALKRSYTRAIRVAFSIFDTVYAILPGCFGVAFLIAFCWYGSEMSPSGFRDLSKWKGTVYGFSPGGHYSRLRMAEGSKISEDQDLGGTEFENSALVSVTISHVRANRANFSRSQLGGANFDSSSLQSALFVGADLRQASFKNADLSDANLRSSFAPGLDAFAGAKLSNADFSGSTVSLSVLLFGNLQEANMDTSQRDAVAAWHGLNPGKGRSFDEIAALVPDVRELPSVPSQMNMREFDELRLRNYEKKRSQRLEALPLK